MNPYIVLGAVAAFTFARVLWRSTPGPPPPPPPPRPPPPRKGWWVTKLLSRYPGSPFRAVEPYVRPYFPRLENSTYFKVVITSDHIFISGSVCWFRHIPFDLTPARQFEFVWRANLREVWLTWSGAHYYKKTVCVQLDDKDRETYFFFAKTHWVNVSEELRQWIARRRIRKILARVVCDDLVKSVIPYLRVPVDHNFL